MVEQVEKNVPQYDDGGHLVCHSNIERAMM